MEQIKRIPIQGIQNLRDLGGYRGKEGCVAWHKLYRCDLPLCDELGWRDLYEQWNVRCVIDLRSCAERSMQDYEIPHLNIQRHAISIIKEDLMKDAMAKSGESQGKEMFEKSMADQYLSMVLANPEAIVAVLHVISESDGAVLYHCTAGKDRTGIITYFLYHLMGIEDVDIMADYQVSSTYNLYGNNSANELLQDLKHQNTMWMHSQPEALFGLMEYFRDHDMEAFLKGHGLSTAALTTLKTRYINGNDSV